MTDQSSISDGAKPHLRIDALKQSVRFKGQGATITNKFRRDQREEHGKFLLSQLDQALQQADLDRNALGINQYLSKGGVYVSVERAGGLPVEKLQQKRNHLTVGAVNKVQNRPDHEVVAYFIPDEQRKFLEEQIAFYRDSDGANKPNAVHKRFEEVEGIRFDGLRSLWTSPNPIPTDGQIGWFEVWLRRKENKNSPDAENWIAKRGQAISVHLSDEKLVFPEIVVRFVNCGGKALRRLVGELGGLVIELRPAQIDASIFTIVRHGDENAAIPDDWINNALDRLTPPSDQSPYVVLHDTGVARAHSLLEPMIGVADLHARNSAWGTDDHDGHGTNMAGIAAFGDLQFPLQSSGAISPVHRLESYKILPPAGSNPPNSYGLVVYDAMSDLLIADAARKRVHCCAITASPSLTGRPSTWSAAIDQVTSGAPNTDLTERGTAQLWIQAVGNVLPHEWQQNEDHLEHPVEDPAQAWNAISVGGFTERSPATEPPYNLYSTAAAVGERSPYSRTSLAWVHSQTPQKPEVVFEAGNWVIEPSGNFLGGFDSLSMLTTGRDVLSKPLECIDMTSPAAAQAARFAATIIAENQDIWPESVRALMIHSADWTPSMWKRLKGVSKETAAAALREFGFGVPNLPRALASRSNVIALVAESEIKPFRLIDTINPETGKKSKSVGLNEAHFYELPWPKVLLNEYYQHEVSLKVVLSWFVEPNPGALGSRYPKTYRSYGLKFDLQRPNETDQKFRARINADEPQDSESSTKDDANWLLGNKQSKAGSLLFDIWKGQIATLLTRRNICVFPQEGWWKARQGARRYSDKGRYCLVVTLNAPTLPVDVYAALAQSINTVLAQRLLIEAAGE